MNTMPGAERREAYDKFVPSTFLKRPRELTSHSNLKVVWSRNVQNEEETYASYGSDSVFRQATLVLHLVN